MSFAMVASVVTIGAGVNSIVQSRRGPQTGANAAAAADPFASQRGPYQDMLAQMLGDLIKDPSTRNSEDDPSYQFEKKEGIGAINNMASSGGLLRSGNRMLDLEKYASGFAHTHDMARQGAQWNRQMGTANLLALLSGATTGNPGAAANSLIAGQNMGTSMFNNGINTVLGGLSTFGGGAKPDPGLNIAS